MLLKTEKILNKGVAIPLLHLEKIVTWELGISPTELDGNSK